MNDPNLMRILWDIGPTPDNDPDHTEILLDSTARASEGLAITPAIQNARTQMSGIFGRLVGWAQPWMMQERETHECQPKIRQYGKDPDEASDPDSLIQVWGCCHVEGSNILASGRDPYDPIQLAFTVPKNRRDTWVKLISLALFRIGHDEQYIPTTNEENSA